VQKKQSLTSQRRGAALLCLDLEEGSQELLRLGVQYAERLSLL